MLPDQGHRHVARHDNTVKVPWLIAADINAVTHHSRSPAACSRLPSGPERRALAAWVPERASAGMPNAVYSTACNHLGMSDLQHCLVIGAYFHYSGGWSSAPA
mgnify:FL=1